MGLAFIALSVVLFFVLSPSVLVRLPKNGGKYTVAAVHALLFGGALFLMHKLVSKFSHLEGFEEGAAANPAAANPVDGALEVFNKALKDFELTMLNPTNAGADTANRDINQLYDAANSAVTALKQAPKTPAQQQALSELNKTQQVINRDKNKKNLYKIIAAAATPGKRAGGNPAAPK